VIDVAAIEEKQTFNLSASAAGAGMAAGTRDKTQIANRPVLKTFNGRPPLFAAIFLHPTV
jgi:hypothetical protein